MKKIVAILTLGLVLGWMNVTAAQASILIDGNAGIGEWVAPYMFSATDPKEALVDDEHNIRTLLVQWDQSGPNDAYFRTDMWGIPNLTADTGWGNNAYVEWQLDLNGDLIGELNVRLEKKSTWLGGDGNIHYYINGVEYGAGYWGMGSIYEVMVPYSIASSFDWTNAKMRVISESGGTSGDDNLPDSGWQPKTPEPGSMVLLGMGLLGFAGVIRRKFMA